MGRIDGYAGEPFDLGSELLIDRVIEPETGDRVEHLMQVAGRVDDALPGKSMIFIRRVWKIINFTSAKIRKGESNRAGLRVKFDGLPVVFG